jgi:serine protease Do
MANENKKLSISWDELSSAPPPSPSPPPSASPSTPPLKIVITEVDHAPEPRRPSHPSPGQPPNHSPVLPRGRSSTVPRVLLAVAAVIAFIAFGGIYGVTRPPKQDGNWISTVSKKAEKSVVRIDTKQGLGTGFVVASSGKRHLILTNRHVLTVTEGIFFTKDTIPVECRVTLNSQHEIKGYFVGLPVDPGLDMAFVLVETAELAPLPIRNFESLQVGEKVVAIGNPQALNFTVTDGIVSATRKKLLIQTNAAINPGNSGGPLLDEQGRVVGINTFILQESQGLNFSIRADIVRLAEDSKIWNCDAGIADLIQHVAR